MQPETRLARALEKSDFIVTAEYLPITGTDTSETTRTFESLAERLTAVNAADNPFGTVLSSLAASVGLLQTGIEPIFQTVTRDRNRIALQSDLLGAASLGIGNVLCLSGYHQTLSVSPESANVYDIDSIQLLSALTRMNEEKRLLDGSPITGDFSMITGAVANPYTDPLELNILRLAKKIKAGAKFIQTQAVFDTDRFAQWLDAAASEGLTKNTAVLPGVQPLRCAEEAERLRETYTEYHIPDDIIGRLKKAGGAVEQQKEGIVIAAEIIGTLKKLTDIRGIHILSGGNEKALPDVLNAAGL